MCLAIPAKIVAIEGTTATVDMMGNRTEADIAVLTDVSVGDYIMVHAGFAIQKYGKAEAEENLAMIAKLAEQGHV